MLGLHLGQDGEILVATGQLRPHERPQGGILDLVMVVELPVDELPVSPELLRSVLVHTRCLHG
jgi:hypothetical protein